MSLIELKNICKTYKSDTVGTQALCGIDLNIDEGEFVAIMGPSGSGKSTLMNIIGFLDEPTKGQYNFEGKKITTYDEDSLAEIRNKKIGFVFQFFHLLPRMTALDNVRLPMIYAGLNEKEQVKRGKKALNAVGLAKRWDHAPNQLSGGEQQRVAIARSLVNQPKIILADEPTGNIDSKASKGIMKILTDLNKEGKTVVVITHDRKIAKYAHRIIKINDGLIQKK